MPRNLTQVTDPRAIEKALAECDRIGRIKFREKYGFRKARAYFLQHKGRTYDSKPIIGVAFGLQHKTKPLHYKDFSGGAASVEPALKRLGFKIVFDDNGDTGPEIAGELPIYSSAWLNIGEVYTRDRLRDIFTIGDATINNGVFRPKESRSIWLFVTRDKTADRPQLVDLLDGDKLHWEGQPAGRTDRMLIDHLTNGDEVLLFYRDQRSQYPNGGFRYEGPFIYASHAGSKPTGFKFDRDQTALIPTAKKRSNDLENVDFDPHNIADGRSQVLAFVKRRQGQPKFRADLIDAYDGRCAITGCRYLPLLEAAHIYPFRGAETNNVTNGILLRADIHTLFDLGLIAINSDGSLDVCASLSETDYFQLKNYKFPTIVSKRPSDTTLKWHAEKIASPSARAALAAKLKGK